MVRFEEGIGVIPVRVQWANGRPALIKMSQPLPEFGPEFSDQAVMEGGEVLLIPSNVRHGAIVLEDTVAIEIFSPPREDFLTDEMPAYMKSQ